ncbi:MAG: hypothetical protein L0Y54_19720 [Sporichthyaceae bacterium]|nr:hypothetical protein [Sporichthyaceae bacterium]
MATPRTSRRDASVGVATLIWLIAIIAALVLILYIVLVIFEANRANSFVDFIADAAHTLAWFFRDLFELDDAKLQVVVNYGLAAAVYLGLGKVLAGGLGNA